MKKSKKKPIRAIDTFKHLLIGLAFLFLSVSVFLLVHANFFSYENFGAWIVGVALSAYLLYIAVSFFTFFYWANKLRLAIKGNSDK